MLYSQYGVGNQENANSLSDATLDEIFSLRSRLDGSQNRLSTLNLPGNSSRVADQSAVVSQQDHCNLQQFSNVKQQSSSFGRSQEESKGLGNHASPVSEVGRRKPNGRNNPANVLIGSPNVAARPAAAPEEPKLPVSSATPKLKSHLARHKHDPINTSTGSSTSGVEISSLSSKSELPTGFALLHPPNARFPYQPSYDPNEFLGPEDFENPLFIYRSLSFRRAIEEGNFQSNLCGGGLNVSSNSQRTLSQRTLQDYCQDSLCFQISQDSGHPQSLSLGSSLSIDGCRLQAPPAVGGGGASLPLGFATEDSRCPRAAWYGRQADSFGSQEDPVEPRLTWKSFTSEDSGCDPTQIVVTDANAEDPFVQSHLAVELRVSPGRRRCLSTLTEEELTEAMNCAPPPPPHHQSSLLSPAAPHPPPPPPPSSSSSRTAAAKFDSGELRGPVSPAANQKSAHGHVGTSSEHCEGREERKSTRSERDRPTSNQALHYGKLPNSAEILKNRAEKPSCQSKDSFVENKCDAVRQPQSCQTSDETKPDDRQDRTTILIKAKRKSLHDMRHLQNIAKSEESLGEGNSLEKSSIPEEEETKSQGHHVENGAVAMEEAARFPAGVGSEFASCFPSLTEEMLHQVGSKEEMEKNASKTPEEISLMETEEKFSSLALAFRTDRHTLDKRIELHLRARDVAEKNIHKELESLKDGIKVLNQSCNSGQSNQQTFAKIHSHLEVLEQSITRMSSRAEDHGAVQQEMRVSQVIEMMVQHVENLKRVYETEHAELQEARKAMNITKSESTDSTGSNKAGDRTTYGATGTGKGSLRRISLALMAKTPKPTRKISIQPDRLIPSTAPSRSESSQPSFFSDYRTSLNSGSSEDTSTGPGEKNSLNRQSSMLTMARSVGSGIRNGVSSSKDERDAMHSSSRLTLKMRGTSKESLSNSVDDKITEDAVYQRHPTRSYLAWLMSLVRVLVSRSDESGKSSFLFRAFSTLLLLKTYFGYVIVLTLISLGFFLLIYHWWMVPDYL